MVYAKGKLFVCDTEEDVKDLPTDRSPGCRARVVSSSALYKLNSAGQWIKQTSGSSGGQDVSELLAQIGNLEDLSTQSKENLVSALNELVAQLQGIIDDESTAADKAWSAEKLNGTFNYFDTRIDNLGGIG